MVTQQAKQRPPEHQQQQQQQQLSLRREVQSVHEAVVADEDNWNPRQRLNGKNNNDINDCNGRCATADDWKITKSAGDNVTINRISQESPDKRTVEVAAISNRDREEATLPRSRKLEGDYGGVIVATGSNGDSTQCSDIEDDDDVEIEEELDEEEEEEEEEEDGGRYEVNEIDSDEDDDDDDDHHHHEIGGNQVEKSERWIKKKVVTTRVLHQTSFGERCGQSEVVPNIDGTNFGEVSVTNSRHVHVGNTNFYKGPVTIKQFVYTNAYPVLDKEDENEGSTSARVSDINPNDVPIVKNDPNGPILPSYHDYDTVRKWLWTWRCAAILCVVALSLVTIVAVISIHLTHNVDVPNKLPESPGTGGGENDTLPGSVRIIDREFWNAQPPRIELDKLDISPTPYVVISHTATTPCMTQSDCTLRVRLIQTFHMESFHWDDIGYNFLVGGDGLAYRGRGWNRAGAHAFGYNYKSIGISFIGTFNDVKPSALQINAAQKLIEIGVNVSKIARSYKLLGHRQVSKTLSPGDQLYKLIQTWDHWSPVPSPVPSSANTANRPRTAAVLPLTVFSIPPLLRLVRRSYRILFGAALLLALFASIAPYTIYTLNMFYQSR